VTSSNVSAASDPVWLNGTHNGSNDFLNIIDSVPTLLFVHSPSDESFLPEVEASRAVSVPSAEETTSPDTYSDMPRQWLKTL
jgi:hypothetical protein